jgi:hypothetical protein
MHLQDRPDLDLSAQVAKVKEKTRPWKAIIALVLAIAAAVASLWAHRYFVGFFETSNVQYQIIAAAWAAAFCVFGSIATIGLASKARWVLERRAGTAHAAIVRYLILLIGGFTVLVVTLSLFHVPLPIGLVWLVHRLGYDRRAWLCQSLLALVVLPVSYWLTDPAENGTWVHGLGAPQRRLPPWLYLALLIVAFSLVLYLPPHLAFVYLPLSATSS